jgi:segregation and condensation protein A
MPATTSTMPLQFHLPLFEGPLDLLLTLLREQKIAITDIPIAQITEQYLAYLALWESLDLNIAGEYLVMAATLVEIKSRMLLPKPPPAPDADPEEDPRAELVQKLLEYERFKGAVETLRGWEEHRSTLFFRGSMENPEDYVLPTEFGAMQVHALVQALQRVLASAGVAETGVTAIIPKRRVSLKMKMAELLRRIRNTPEGLEFDRLFEGPIVLQDVVMTFLAMLELLKQTVIRFTQSSVDGPIVLFGAEQAPA